METSKWEGTKEKINVIPAFWSKGAYCTVIPNTHDAYNASTFVELQANSILFTDAVHTIQECEMMPSKLLEIVKAKDRQLNESDKEIAEWEEENAKLKREIEEMKDKSLSRADKVDERTGGRSLAEVLESEEKLKEALKWRHLSDEMPNEERHYLVKKDGHHPYVAYYHIDRMKFKSDGELVFPTHFKSINILDL